MKKICRSLFLCLFMFVLVSGNVYAVDNNPSFDDNSPSDKFQEIYYESDSCIESGGIPTKCGIPAGLADMIHDFYDLLKIAVPVVLVILGMIDLLKAVAGQKEEDIKKGWNTLIRRTIYGVMVFFVFTTVQLVISLLPGNNTKVLGCVKEFFTGSGGEFKCIETGANTNNNG